MAWDIGIAIACPLPNCMAGERAAFAAQAAGKDQTSHQGKRYAAAYSQAGGMTDRWQSLGFHTWLARQYGPCDITAKSWKRVTAKGIPRKECDGKDGRLFNPDAKQGTRANGRPVRRDRKSVV